MIQMTNNVLKCSFKMYERSITRENQTKLHENHSQDKI